MVLVKTKIKQKNLRKTDKKSVMKKQQNLVKIDNKKISKISIENQKKNKKNIMNIKVKNKKEILKKTTKKVVSKIKKALKVPIKKKLGVKIKVPKEIVLKKKKVLNKNNKKAKASFTVSDNFPKKEESLKLHKSINNPIIEPRPYDWESRATFNPTAFVLDGKIHIIYRAIGNDDVSVLGYASSFDGYNIEDRLTHYIYKRFMPFVKKEGEPLNYCSGGGWSGGCEDPRVTLLDGNVYVLFNAFDGWSSVRVAMISISLEDFKKKRWDKWSKITFLSPEGQISKAWVLFPEKINGKIAILNDIWPSVSVVYLDDFSELESGKIVIRQKWDRWFHNMIPSNWVYINPGSDGGRFVDPDALKKNIWGEVEKDLWIRSVGPSPIKTKDGWLILHHAMEAKDPGKFKVFAMLLDLNNPTKVLYRSNGPILEPAESYENNITYSCGAVVKSGRLFVYYGANDKFVAVASVKLQTLLDDLKTNKMLKLTNFSKKLVSKKIKK